MSTIWTVWQDKYCVRILFHDDRTRIDDCDKRWHVLYWSKKCIRLLLCWCDMHNTYAKKAITHLKSQVKERSQFQKQNKPFSSCMGIWTRATINNIDVDDDIVFHSWKPAIFYRIESIKWGKVEYKSIKVKDSPPYDGHVIN